MRKLHGLIISSFIGPLLLTFLITIFVLVMQFLWKYIDDMVGKGISTLDILELLLYASAQLITWALPIAIMFASIMTFGNMGENNELLACKSAGISLQRIMFPIFILVSIMSVGGFYFANHVLPITNFKLKQQMIEIKTSQPEFQIQAGQFYDGIPGFVLKVEKKDQETGKLSHITIFDHTLGKGNTKVITADSGYIAITEDELFLSIKLYNGYSFEEKEKNRRRNELSSLPHQREKFAARTMRLAFSTGDDDQVAIYRKKENMFSLNQIKYMIDSLSKRNDTISIRLDNEVTKKHFLKGENRKLEKDSLYSASSNYISDFNTDTILASLSLIELNQVLKHAVASARTSRNPTNSAVHKTKANTNQINRLLVAKHSKFVFPVSCFIFFLIGAPLGAIIRKGGLGMPAVMSIVFFILFYMISLVGEKSVKQDMATEWAIWSSSFVLFPIGLFLTYKATTDSVLLNASIYFDWFKKLFPSKDTTIQISDDLLDMKNKVDIEE